MKLSPWTWLSATERRLLAPTLLAVESSAPLADEALTAAGRRFDFLLHQSCREAGREAGRDAASGASASESALRDRVLTAQNFLRQLGARQTAPLWRQIHQFNGISRSYLELTVRDRDEFLRLLRAARYVVNRELPWTIHKFDSARARTTFARQPSLHFANDRHDEPGYGPNYFFVHWDPTSVWFQRSQWRFSWLPGVRWLERWHAARQHHEGSASPQHVQAYLRFPDRVPD
ncbi:MAG: hypothetical protein JNJ50_02055 [Acidobacteria bacterium]|nr:hypothetical protein [Acidobacteriota bacterium]